MASSVSFVLARRPKIASARAGTTFIALPPSVMTPCTRASPSSCCRQPRGLGRGDEEGADVADRDQVVTAAVTDLGQRVVLGKQRDGRRPPVPARPSGPDMRAECRLEPADAPLDVVAAALEKRGDAVDGATLLIRQLRIGVDGAGKGDKIARLWAGKAGHRGGILASHTFPL